MRLVLLPGLGTTGQLFDPRRRALPSLEVPPWLEPEPGETLPAYGRRMAAALHSTGPDVVLGGVSFGGMVAIEMARHAPVRALVLIASCATGLALTRAARILARAGSAVPARALRPPRVIWPAVAWAFGAQAGPDRAFLYDLIATSRPAFAKWALGAIADWRPSDLPACPVRHIHGSADRLIHVCRVQPDLVVAGAGHLINVTHAEEVNAFLAEALASVTLREAGAGERERVRAFYVSCGRSVLLDPGDRLLVAEAEGEIVGAVRLCVEEGAQVLRTMRVRPDVQGRGIGRALLRRFLTMLDDRDCFCLPYAHLGSFYGAIGFARVAPAELPPHLAARLAGYLAERPDVIAMRRRP
jgi:pimeloyl-ACP methyl ester carboxylesterase/N-acetylglutamate synthase-like GNAT family acetyltransferase